jgi:hypothetical protein
MATTAAGLEHPHAGRGPKYEVNIEGTTYPWDRDHITVPELRTLGNLPGDQAVEEINLATNEQRTLPEGEVVELKPGLGFSKKIKFQRG